MLLVPSVAIVPQLADSLAFCWVRSLLVLFWRLACLGLAPFVLITAGLVWLLGKEADWLVVQPSTKLVGGQYFLRLAESRI